MKSQKLLENKEGGASVREKQKSERTPRVGTTGNPAQQSRLLIPFRLELAGNRFSPLHEW
jgi:hypothetical protein